MTDIVERLRNCAIDDAISTMTDAAAEIERLRSALTETSIEKAK